MTINQLIHDQREAILRLAAEHGATQVGVFGSVARGEATDDIDIDFCVQLRDGASMFDAVGLWQDLSALLNRKVDLVTLGADEQFDKRIARDIVLL